MTRVGLVLLVLAMAATSLNGGIQLAPSETGSCASVESGLFGHSPDRHCCVGGFTPCNGSSCGYGN